MRMNCLGLRPANIHYSILPHINLSFLLIHFLLFSTSNIICEELKYQFEQLTMRSGLSYNCIEEILQDHQGYLWIGTRNGLNKYDGYDIRIFQNDPDDPRSLRDNVIEAIYEDRTGVLWIGTQDGWLEKYNRKTDQFTHYHLGSHVKAIFEDLNGTLWVGTQKPGLLQFNRNTGDTTVIWPGANITTFYEDSHKRLWVIGQDGNCGRYDPKTEFYQIFDFNTPLSSIVEIKPDVFFMGSYQKGVIRYDAQSGKEILLGEEHGNRKWQIINSVSSLYIDDAKNIWIGTAGHGIYHWDQKRDILSSFQNNPNDVNSLSDNHVTSIFQDRSGVVWFGTVYRGVNKFSQRKTGFHLYHHQENKLNSLSNNIVNTIHEDELGNLWIGTENGLNRLDKQTGQWHHYFYSADQLNSISHNMVFSILEDSRQMLWIGTEAGIDRFDRTSDSFTRFPLSRVHDILEESGGSFLLATSAGLYRFNPQAQEQFIEIKKGYCWKISLLKDREGVLWLGSSGCGLERHNPQTGQWNLFSAIEEDTTSISDNYIESILEDRSGILWFATAGGLNRWNRKMNIFTSFRDKDQLTRDWYHAVLEDEKDYLWLSHSSGIARFNPETKSFLNFFMDRLKNHSFRRGAYFKGKDGRMFFGGSKGVTFFDPNQIETNPNPPPMVLSNINLFNQPIQKNLSTHGKLELSYDKNFLSFDFAALDFTQPEKNRYAYKMIGLDENWIYAGNRRHADYPDLKPGEYVFKVKGTNNDGVWNEDGLEVVIQISAPFWRTWWFNLLILIFILSSAFAAYRSRVRFLERKRLDLEMSVKEKTESANALKNALDEVEILKNRLQAENIYLQDEIKNVHNFEDIITNSENLKKVLKSVEQVAATDATVLILGESGTGKELIARAIHNISSRNERVLVKVNCAVLPANLIESELFGHEKGAFTGAISFKTGRFEMADGGTIFLDEIGELPLELQAKLLRVLQEGEFERLGNPKCIKVNVRIIAATNRILENEVQQGKFREDLYYRLNVFPIHLPPLRERKEDIPMLTNHFVKKYSGKVGKRLDTISRDVFSRLKEYNWPGNVRELENFIERAVIISPENKLVVGDWLPVKNNLSEEAGEIKLEEVERNYIIKILEKTNWRISGENGAAQILGLKRTTLEARMKKLGIIKKK